MLGKLAIGFDFNVRSWHRADKLSELKVCYERGADVGYSVKRRKFSFIASFSRVGTIKVDATNMAITGLSQHKANCFPDRTPIHQTFPHFIGYRQTYLTLSVRNPGI
jgi:hypothetical protein